MFKIAFGCFWPSVAVPSPLSIERECFKSGLWCLCLKKNVGIALDCLTLERTIPKHSKTCLWASATHQKHFFLPPLPLSFQIWRHMDWSENWRETWWNPSNLMAHISSSLFPHFGYPPQFSVVGEILGPSRLVHRLSVSLLRIPVPAVVAIQRSGRYLRGKQKHHLQIYNLRQRFWAFILVAAGV